MPELSPVCYVIGGPNGAGKTSASLRILPQMGCLNYVNADAIAAALSPFQPEKSAIEAGRMMLKRIDDLAAEQTTFAFETTLASRSFVPFLKRLKGQGYQVVLLYFYLASPELAIARVKERVAAGGHDIPEDTIVRRYGLSLHNLNQLYKPVVDDWVIYDNSEIKPILLEKSPQAELEPLSFWINDAIAKVVDQNRKLGTPIYILQDGQIEDVSKVAHIKKSTALTDKVYSHAEKLRDTINKKQGFYLKHLDNLNGWHIFCSAMDALEDYALGIKWYKSSPCFYFPDGSGYIKLTGLLQATFVQQDAVSEMLKVLGLPLNKVSVTPALRKVRNDVVGHPILRHSDYSCQLNRNSVIVTKNAEVISYVKLLPNSQQYTKHEQADIKKLLIEHEKWLIVQINKITTKLKWVYYKHSSQKNYTTLPIHLKIFNIYQKTKNGTAIYKFGSIACLGS